MNAVLVKVIFTLLAFIISNPSIPQSVKDQSIALVGQTAISAGPVQQQSSSTPAAGQSEGYGISGAVLGGASDSFVTVNSKTGATTTTDAVIVQGKVYVRDLPFNLPFGSTAPIPVYSSQLEAESHPDVIQYYAPNRYGTSLQYFQRVDR